FVRWLERSGYDVKYSTDVDTHENSGRLLNSKVFLSGAHNEYWSKEMYDGVQQARDAGVHLGFFGADAVYWQVRFEPSPLTGAADRVMVGYKDRTIDPVQGPTKIGRASCRERGKIAGGAGSGVQKRERIEVVFFFQAEDGIRDGHVTGVQTCALPIYGVQQARDAGVHLGFFGADAVYWQVRFEPSPLTGAADRVMVGYKDRTIDPVQGPTTTILWRDLNRPEQQLMGVQFTGSIDISSPNAPYVVANSSSWVYAGTGLHDGDSIPKMVGYECDSS